MMIIYKTKGRQPKYRKKWKTWQEQQRYYSRCQSRFFKKHIYELHCYMYRGELIPLWALFCGVTVLHLIMQSYTCMFIQREISLSFTHVLGQNVVLFEKVMGKTAAVIYLFFKV